MVCRHGSRQRESVGLAVSDVDELVQPPAFLAVFVAEGLDQDAALVEPARAVDVPSVDGARVGHPAELAVAAGVVDPLPVAHVGRECR